MNQDIVIFDIDGTLANVEHRLHHIRCSREDPSFKPDWEAFYAQCHLDSPIEPIAHLARLARQDWLVWLFTGREETLREATVNWLKGHHIYYDDMVMRPKGDYRRDSEIKREWLYKLGIKDRVALVIEDRAQTVKMWREEGLLCLQCAEGEF